MNSGSLSVVRYSFKVLIGGCNIWSGNAKHFLNISTIFNFINTKNVFDANFLNE